MSIYGLEEKTVDIFRNLTWLYLSYMLVRGGSTVRHEEMGMGMPDQNSHLFPLLMVLVPL